MSKVRIDTNAFTYPMPMTPAGATVGDEPSFLVVAVRGGVFDQAESFDYAQDGVGHPSL
jgi:hypothetical protein